MQGTIFSAHTPWGECYSFCDEAEPTLQKKCRISEHIKDEIDAGLDKTSGNFIVEAEVATGTTAGAPPRWEFDAQQTLELFAPTRDAAKDLASFYGERALITARKTPAAERA